MESHIMKIAIIDYKIDELVSRKKYLENRIMELYEMREDIICDMEYLEKKCCNNCCNEE